MRTASAVGIASLVATPHLMAQNIVAVGARVRVTSAASSASGNVVALTRDSIAIVSEGQTTPTAFRRDALSRLEVSVGKHPNGLKGFAIGTLVGAGIGAIAGYLTFDAETRCQGVTLCFQPSSAKASAAQNAYYSGFVGAVIGVIAGRLKRSDRWIVASQSSALVPLVDGQGRVGLAVRWSH